MNRATLFLNGQPPDKCPDVDPDALVVCVDGAYRYLKQWNVVPDFLLGDMDSVEDLREIPSSIAIVETPDQNHTDFEKALTFIRAKGIENVEVYGSSGLQQDHFLGNLTVAVKYQNHLTLRFFDDHGIYFFLGHRNELNDVKGKTISLIPFPIAEGVTTKGLAYPLNNRNLDLTQEISVRNKAIQNTVSISFEWGNLLIFILNN